MFLELEDVVSGYLRDVNILQGISLEVEPGEIVCLIGPNGAGKSTTLRVISGLLKPRRGRILFDGNEIGGLRPDLVLQRGIAHVPQGHSSFPEMTVYENLMMGAYLVRERSERERRLEWTYELFPWFFDRRRERAGYLSGGQQKLLEVGRALMFTPRVLLLDEPSLGLAPMVAETVFETITRLRDETNVTILMVEQNARKGLMIADRGYVLDLGTVRLSEPAEKLLKNPMVERLYLGGSVDTGSPSASV